MVKSSAMKSVSKKRLSKAIKKTQRMSDKKAKKRQQTSFSLYIHRVLKQVYSGDWYPYPAETQLGAQSLPVLNSYVNDIFERLASEAGRRVLHRGMKTLTEKDIRAAVRLVLPGELAKVADREATKAVAKYTAADK